MFTTFFPVLSGGEAFLFFSTLKAWTGGWNEHVWAAEVVMFTIGHYHVICISIMLHHSLNSNIDWEIREGFHDWRKSEKEFDLIKVASESKVLIAMEQSVHYWPKASSICDCIFNSVISWYVCSNFPKTVNALWKRSVALNFGLLWFGVQVINLA